jgi:hypothetical protein
MSGIFSFIFSFFINPAKLILHSAIHEEKVTETKVYIGLLGTRKRRLSVHD